MKPKLHPGAIRKIRFDCLNSNFYLWTEGETWLNQEQALKLAKELAETFGGFEVKEEAPKSTPKTEYTPPKKWWLTAPFTVGIQGILSPNGEGEVPFDFVSTPLPYQVPLYMEDPVNPGTYTHRVGFADNLHFTGNFLMAKINFNRDFMVGEIKNWKAFTKIVPYGVGKERLQFKYKISSIGFNNGYRRQ